VIREAEQVRKRGLGASAKPVTLPLENLQLLMAISNETLKLVQLNL